ncbi:MAG: cadherin [Thiolinea sp.]
MKNSKLNVPFILKAATASLLAFATGQASAAVQYRIGFDTTDNSYAVYMTPDSTPERDMLLSAQVTLVVPHDEQNRFTVDNVQSMVANASWATNSRIDAPRENMQADYISLNYSFNGELPPSFDWVAGQEKKIFSFNSATGCDVRVKLIDNSDAFNQLPNSANTNPGNDFMNLGWMMSNSYIGNYGSAIQCGQVVQNPEPQPEPQDCDYTDLDKFYQGRIDRLQALREAAPAYLHQRYDAAIENLKTKLSCQP